MERCFYFTERWQQARGKFPGSNNRQVRWWDDGDQGDIFDERTAAPEALADPSLDPSIRGRLDVLVETFVRGNPLSRLVRPVGAGMDPPFKRMERRGGVDFSPVVEMRTRDTRTFGFFARKDMFVAHRLDLADNTHSDPSLYEKYGMDVLKFLDRLASSEKDLTSDIEDLIGE